MHPLDLCYLCSEDVQCLLLSLKTRQPSLLPVPTRRIPASWNTGAGKSPSSCLCPCFPPSSSFGEFRRKKPLWLAPRQMAALKLRALITTIIFSRNILEAVWFRAVQAPARGWELQAEQEAAGKSREKGLDAPPKLWDTSIYLNCALKQFQEADVHWIWIQIEFSWLGMKAGWDHSVAFPGTVLWESVMHSFGASSGRQISPCI